MATLLIIVVILLAIFKPTLLVSTVFWIAAGPLAIWAIIRFNKINRRRYSKY